MQRYRRRCPLGRDRQLFSFMGLLVICYVLSLSLPGRIWDGLARVYQFVVRLHFALFQSYSDDVYENGDLKVRNCCFLETDSNSEDIECAPCHPFMDEPSPYSCFCFAINWGYILRSLYRYIDVIEKLGVIAIFWMAFGGFPVIGLMDVFPSFLLFGAKKCTD